MAFKPYVQEAYKKEFIVAMRHKGKMPKMVTDASERFEAAYHDTVPRIFPGPGGMETVLSNMLTSTEKRIDAAQPSSDPITRQAYAILDQTAQTAPSHLAEHAALATAAGTHAGKLNRHQIKSQMHHMEVQLQRERQQRLLSEGKLEQAAAEQRGRRVLANTLKQATTGTLQERMVAQGKLPSHERRTYATNAVSGGSRDAYTQQQQQQGVGLGPFEHVGTVRGPSQQEVEALRGAQEAAQQQSQQDKKRQMRAKLLQVEAEMRHELEREVAARQEFDLEVVRLRERILAAQGGAKA